MIVSSYPQCAHSTHVKDLPECLRSKAELIAVPRLTHQGLPRQAPEPCHRVVAAGAEDVEDVVAAQILLHRGVLHEQGLVEAHGLRSLHSARGATL